MFESKAKTATIQIRVTEDEKAVLELMAKRSPQGDVSTLLRHLIKQEYDRVIEFDQEVKNFRKEG